MSPIRFRPKKDDEEEDESKETKEEEKLEESKDSDKDDSKEKIVKKFQISSEIEAENENKNDFENSEENQISDNIDNIDEDINEVINKESNDTTKIEFELIGKDDSQNILSELYVGKNIVVVTFPDKSNFVTTEDNFENIKKQLDLSENKFQVIHRINADSLEIPFFLLKKANIRNGDPLSFKFNEQKNTIEIKKKK